jgi:beta-lactamase class D
MSERILAEINGFNLISKNSVVLLKLLRENPIERADNIFSDWKQVMEANDWIGRYIIQILREVSKKLDEEKDHFLIESIDTWIGNIQIDIMNTEF